MQTIVGRPAFWAISIASLFALVIGSTVVRGAASRPPPVIGSFPAFSGRDDRGDPFSEQRLRGRAFIANRLTPGGAATIHRLEGRTRNLGDALVLVSFSGAALPPRGDPRSEHRWLRIEGELPRDALGADGDLVLVDETLRIRGRYRPDQIDELLRDVSLVVNGR